MKLTQREKAISLSIIVVIGCLQLYKMHQIENVNIDHQRFISNYDIGIPEEKKEKPIVQKNKSITYKEKGTVQENRNERSQLPVKKQGDKKQKSLFSFDPNSADKGTLLSLGFYEEVANRLLKYREAGGRFRSKADLKKVYGLSDPFYKRLEPYISIKAEFNTKTKPLSDSFLELSLNHASFGQLIKLPNMDHKIAGRILKYRDILGGYADLNQLYNVYEIDTTKISDWKKHLRIDAHSWQQYKVNQMTEAELRDLPFFDKKQASQLINYKNHHGPFSSFDELQKALAIEPKNKQILKSYLLFTEPKS